MNDIIIDYSLCNKIIKIMLTNKDINNFEYACLQNHLRGLHDNDNNMKKGKLKE
jgi:hypothetical protein